MGIPNDLVRFLTKSFHIVRDFADFQKLCGIVWLLLNCAVPHLHSLSERLFVVLSSYIYWTVCW